MANRLRLFRVLKNMSQPELALRAGIPQPRISEMERGRRIPTEEEKRDIARSLGVKIESVWPQGRLKRRQKR